MAPIFTTTLLMDRTKLLLSVFSLALLLIIAPTSALASGGLLAHWNFDESVGTTAADSSGNNYTGTLNGGSSFLYGIQNNAIYLNGDSGYVDVSPLPDTTGTFTVTAWVRPDSLTQSSNGGGVGGTIIDQNEDGGLNGWNLGIRDDGRIWFWGGGGDDLFSTSTVPLHEWTHIAVTYDGTNVRMYINGALDSTQPLTITQGSSGFFKIGALSWVTGFWKGKIDELYLYDHALSDSEIYQNYMSVLMPENFDGGDGTLGNPFQISTCDELQGMRYSATSSYTLTGDVDCSATSGWYGGAGFEQVLNYSGTFNGNHHVIKNLTINQPDDNNIGLFGSVLGGTVENVTLSGGSINGHAMVGGLVGALSDSGIVSNAGSSASVSGGDQKIGGLIGSIADQGSVVKYSSSTAAITNTQDNSTSIGGLVGDNYGTIEESESAGTINITSVLNYSGGLVGDNEQNATITNASSSEAITSTGSSLNYVGGFVGGNGGTIQNSFFTGSLNGTVTQLSEIGGFVGNDASNNGITNSYYNIDQVTLLGSHYTTDYGLNNAQYTDWVQGGYAPLSLGTYFTLDGNGYYDIGSLAQLEDLLPFLRTDLSSDKFKLTTSLTLPSEFYLPYTNMQEFDGGGHTISGLSLNRYWWGSEIGFIGFANTTLVHDLTISNATLAGYYDVGGVVGLSHGSSLVNATSSAAILGSEDLGGILGNGDSATNLSYTSTAVTMTASDSPEIIGGLVGEIDGTVDHSNVTGTVTSMGGGQYYIGGFAGYSQGTIDTSSSSVAVLYSAGDAEIIGGFIGENDNTVTNSHSTGSVLTNGPGGYSIGGFNGDNYGTFTNDYATGAVEGNSQVGGFDGYGDGNYISQSFASGAVTGIGNSPTYIAGFVGYNYDQIHDSFETGTVQFASDVTGTPDYIGGFAGYANATLQDDYAAGDVHGLTAQHVAGFIAQDYSATVNDFYAGHVTGTNAAGFMSDEEDAGLTNDAWWTGAVQNNVAIASDVTSNTINVPTLASHNYGTDVANASDFYDSTNPVYAAGQGTAWDFTTPVWVAHADSFPTLGGEPNPFVPAAPTSTPDTDNHSGGQTSGGGGGSSGGSVQGQVRSLDAMGKTDAANQLMNQYPALFAGSTTTSTVVQTTNVATNAKTPVSFTKNLQLGSKGTEVQALQLYLIGANAGPLARALAAKGATGYFGPVTKAALIEFQKARKITPASGLFGPKTRAYMLSH